jgi:uncharacterized membrane protein HdeD (DUF308 family)
MLVDAWLLANLAMSLLLLRIVIGVHFTVEGVATATMTWTARNEMR